MQMKPLKSGSFPHLSPRTPYSVFRAPFWHKAYGDKALWGSGLEWYTIDYKESSRFALYNLWSSEISTTNLQQAPFLTQTLNITYRPAWELRFTFWRSVQYGGISGIQCFQRAFCFFRTVNHLAAWVLLSRLALTWNIDPSTSSILSPQTIHTKD